MAPGKFMILPVSPFCTNRETEFAYVNCNLISTDIRENTRGIFGPIRTDFAAVAAKQRHRHFLVDERTSADKID